MEEFKFCQFQHDELIVKIHKLRENQNLNSGENADKIFKLMFEIRQMLKQST